MGEKQNGDSELARPESSQLDPIELARASSWLDSSSQLGAGRAGSTHRAGSTPIEPARSDRASSTQGGPARSLHFAFFESAPHDSFFLLDWLALAKHVSTFHMYLVTPFV